MNKLYKSLIYENQVSLSVLETTALVQDAIKIHGLNDVSAEILGGFLTATAYMAGCLKSPEGAVSITVKSGDGSATLSVSGDINGNIRGYIEGAEGGLKGGTMTVIKDDGFFRPFVGVCELKAPDVSENLMQYFHQSEQIPTAVAIRVKVKDGVCKAAGGVIMQLMPGCSEENSLKAENRMQAFLNVDELIGNVGADGIMRDFASDGPSGEPSAYLTFPRYKCNCSRKKLEAVLLSVGKTELYEILKEQGKVSVHCHYCNTDYNFFEKDIEKLFSGD